MNVDDCKHAQRCCSHACPSLCVCAAFLNCNYNCNGPELQLQSQQVRGATVFDALKGVARAGGVGALFTAIRPGLACAALGFGVYFGSYAFFKPLATAAVGPESDVPAFVPNLLSAGAAGCLTTIANNPLMVIKTRMILSLPVDLRAAKSEAGVPPVRLSGHVPSVAEVARKVYRTQGLRGFYAGVTPSLAGNAEAAIHMALYEVIKKSIVQAPGTLVSPSLTYSALTAGSGFAKVLSATLAYPLAPSTWLTACSTE